MKTQIIRTLVLIIATFNLKAGAFEPDLISTIDGCDCHTNGFSSTTGQSCVGNICIELVLISRNITTVSDISGVVQASGEFTFRISPSEDYYFYRTIPMRSLRVVSLSHGTNIIPKAATFSSLDVAVGDTADYYVVRGGESRTFTLSFIIEPTEGGIYKVEATSLEGFTKGSDMRFSSGFVTDALYLKGATPSPLKLEFWQFAGEFVQIRVTGAVAGGHYRIEDIDLHGSWRGVVTFPALSNDFVVQFPRELSNMPRFWRARKVPIIIEN